MSSGSVAKAANSVIEIDGDVVKKTLPADLNLEQVLTKHQLFYELALKKGFRTPKPIDSLCSGSVLGLEYIELGEPLTKIVREFLRSGVREDLCLTTMHRLGVTLAQIHRNFDLVPPMKVSAEHGPLLHRFRNLDAATDMQVFLHGDFTLNNIFVNGDQLVIIDPLPNNHTTFLVNEKSSFYLDLAIFCNSIIRQIGYVDLTPGQWKRAHMLIHQVLAGYNREVSPFKVDTATLGDCVVAVDITICRARKLGIGIGTFRRVLSRFLVTQCIRKL